MTANNLREQISQLVAQYANEALSPKPFVAGTSVVPPSGKVIGAKELQLMVEASLDGWLTTGRFNDAFEKKLGEFIGVPHVLTTTSGSSANLLALTALTSPKLGERALKPGDEVITVAAGFPTTVNPAIQNGLIPVFVDVDIPTYNIDASLIEAAVTEKSKAIMIAHTLGNAFNLSEVRRIADKYNLWLIEDCCDALGTTYEGQMVGTFGDIGTVSFYPAHHITMGEGGAVFTKSGELKKIIESFRDWGRDCYCAPGCDNTCGKRFGQQLGSLPQGYDHKYTYSHLLWPICAELRVKQQWKKLNKMIGVNILLGSLYVVGCTIFIYLFKEQIFSVIAKDINYQVSILSFMLIGIYFCIRVWCDTYAMLLQSMNYLKILWILVPLQAIIGGIAQWYFSSTLGISGVLLGLIISFALTVFWGLPLTYLIKANKG